jgi:predicted ATP-grasp superfamily ATP-dependent carboligase
VSSSPDRQVVILTAATWGSGLHALRSAKSLRVRTVAVTVGASASVFRASRFCDDSLEIPDVADADLGDLLVRAFERLGSHPTLVIPLSDRLASVLDAVRSRLGPHVTISVDRSPGLDRLLSKCDQAELAAGIGLDVPAWARVSGGDGMHAALELPLPVVVKPDGVRTSAGDCGKVEVFDSHHALEVRLRDLAGQGATVMVQHRIVAPENAVEFALLWRSGRSDASAACTGRKARLAHRDGGVMVWGEAIDLPDIAAAAAAFTDASGFHGLGGAEFIRTAGHLWFIEFNPRLEAIHFLAAAAGVDLVALEVGSWLGDPDPAPSAAVPAAAWVGSAAFARLRAEPSALPQLLADRRRYGRSERRRRSMLAADDLKPILVLWRLMMLSGARRLVAR